MEALSNAHEAILAEYTAKKELCDELRQAIQQLKEDSAGVRASRDATCAERSDPACSSKLAKMVDMAKARQAHRKVLAYLETVDIAAQRRDAALQVAASIAFALLVTAGLVIFVLWQRGFI